MGNYLKARFDKPFEIPHLTLINRLETIILNGGKQAIAMPRGTGKTAIVVSSILWALVYGHCRYIVLIAANVKESRKLLRGLRRVLANNPLLIDDFPEICYPIKELGTSALLARGQRFYGRPTSILIEADNLVLPTIPGSRTSGSKIVAVGIKSAIRGQNEELPTGQMARPDLILIDDPQTDDMARNPERCKDLVDYINATVKYLVGHGDEAAIVLTCTVMVEGDAADLFLDHETNPDWNGLRIAALETMPERMDLWRRFRLLWYSSFDAAKDFYRTHLREMQKGATVTLPNWFKRGKYLDALHQMMCDWSEDERSFWSEKQNRPLRPNDSDTYVSSKTIIKRVNGLGRGVCPNDAARITGFVDVHDDVLYWAVAAWTTDMTGYIIDYGTFPEQSRNYFIKSNGGLETLATLFPGNSKDGTLKMGIEAVLHELIDREYETELDAQKREIDRILIDSRYKTEIVDAAIRQVGDVRIIPAIGLKADARNRPMAQWPKRPGRIFGFHYLDERIKDRPFRVCGIDTNFWKSRVHESFSLETGERGSLSFWGESKTAHRMIAEHIAAEDVKRVYSEGNAVNEWKPKPTSPDNHYFDCVVGSMACACTLGIIPQEILIS